jgi:hypothetical protein
MHPAFSWSIYTGKCCESGCGISPDVAIVPPLHGHPKLLLFLLYAYVILNQPCATSRSFGE